MIDGVLEEYELEEDLDEGYSDDSLEEINLEEDYLDEDLDVFEEEIELEETKNEAQDPAQRANVEKDAKKNWEDKQAEAKKKCKGTWKPGKYINMDDNSPGHCDRKVELTKESRRIERQNKSLLKEQAKLNNKTQLLEERLNKYGTIINKLNNKLNESNLLNAKLLYQNRVLDSISLNERQKDKIVDAIQNANSVEEAKIIFETLQSTVGTRTRKNEKVPESLNEVVTRSSSAFLPRKEEKRKGNNLFAERMKTLAGLK